MSKTRTQTAQTAVGEVEYETVACENCENDVMVENAKYVGLGLHETKCDGYTCGTTHETFERSVPLCEFCAETFGFDDSGREWLPRPSTGLEWSQLLVVGGLAMLLGFSGAIAPAATAYMTILLVVCGALAIPMFTAL